MYSYGRVHPICLHIGGTSVEKHLMIQECYSCKFSGGDGYWEVQLRRPLKDWEIKKVTQFLDLVYPLKVQEEEDTSLWKEDSRGLCEVVPQITKC